MRDGRYFFKLYALDALLGALRSPTKAQLERALQGQVLAQRDDRRVKKAPA